MKNQILIFLCFLFYQVGASAQQGITVKGSIVDVESGLPIAGVNILEQGTTIGVMTDFDGTFTITVNPNAILEISYIGYATQLVPVNEQTLLDIKMKSEISQLDEVIVVGYGTQKKGDLTGSVVRANIEDFTDQPNVSIVQSLQGTVAGLNVGTVTGAGGSPSISIRGRNTFARDANNRLVNSDPLIVLDGVIYRGALIDINTADVASVDILKDASAKAIYGSQAANGVVLITTKTGKKSSKPVYNFSTYYSAQSPANKLTPLNREEYIQKTLDFFWEDFYDAPDYLIRNNTVLDRTYFGGEFQEGFDDGTETDWLDLATQQAFIYNTNFSMAGSTDKINYFLSTGYTEQEAWAKNDEYSKVNIRANFDVNVSDAITVGAQTFLSTSDFSGQAANLRNAYIASPLAKPYEEDGSINLFPGGNDPNPLAALEVDDFDKRLNLFGNFYAKIEIPFLEGLSYKINYSTNYRNFESASFDPNGNNETGSAGKSHSIFIDETIDNLVNYKRTFNKHNIDVTLLYGRESRQGRGTGASTRDFVNQALGYNNLGIGSVEENRVSSFAWEEFSLYQMGSLNYKFNNKYLAKFIVRRDGFSGFGSNSKFGIFPSLALGWVASNEPFIAEAFPWLNNLKLRASYGKNGNRTVGRYQTLARVVGGFNYAFGDGGSSAYALKANKLGNNDLGWETTTGLNLGLDFSVLNSRLSGTLEYYDSKTEDILFNKNIPLITGFPDIATSLGEVANTGFEVSLNSINVQSDNFKWSSSVVYSTNSNKIVSIEGKDDDGDGVEDDLINSSFFIGESIGTIYGYEENGKYQIGDTDIPSGYNPGDYRLVDINEDGQITPLEDRKILGHTEPAYRFSVFNEFTYKNFGLSIFINSVQGGKDGYLENNNAKQAEFGWQRFTVNTFNTVKEFDYWTPSNPNGEYSGLRYGRDDTALYRDRSFVRLQDVRLSYNLPKSILDKLSISDLRLFLSGKNLHTWTKWKGIDPESGAGFSVGSNPVLESYTLGLNLTF